MHRRQIGKSLVVVRAPEVTVVAHIYQLCADDQVISALSYFACEHCTHPKRATDLLRIRQAAFVVKDRVARHHSQRRQLREVVDQAVSDAVGEVLSIWVRAYIDEGQNREGIDRRYIPVENSEVNRSGDN